MTDEDIKNFIKSYKELNAKKQILDKITEVSINTNSKNEDECALLKIKIQVIESCLQILEKDEREIILLHLIDNIKWSEIIVMYEERLGTEYNYSERTFKRIQKSALQNIVEFIRKNQLEQYITNS